MTRLTPRRRRWRIGELAEATGVTVRTLHHYEHTGLLVASERTDGGHRLYDRESLKRVYQIKALRELGFSLAEIQKAIAGRISLTDLLRKNLERIEVQMARTTLLRDRLRDMTVHGNPNVSVDELPATLDAISRLEKRSQVQRCTCAPDAAREESWRKIRDELRKCMDRGDQPCSERANAIALQARSLITEIAGADPALPRILKVIARLSKPRNLAGWDQSLMQYLDLALGALDDRHC